MARFVRTPAVFLAVPFILLFFFLALDSLIGDSPTMDEQNHVARGLVYLRTGDPRFSLEHPPLINALSALPLLTESNIELPLDHPSWEQREGWYAFADELFWGLGYEVSTLIFLARLPIVFLTLGLGLVGFHFAREMWGKIAAIAAFILLMFEPNILAHGRYSTTDLGGTFFLLLSAYLLWRLWKIDSWHWGRLILAGLALGLALGAKLSIVVFLPIFVLMALLPIYNDLWRWKDAGRRIAELFIATFIGLIVLWAVYGFEFAPSRFIGSWAAFFEDVRLPLATYWAGLEQIFTLSEGGRPSYLFGEFSDSGWWYYFPVTYLVKTPIILLLLTAVSSVFLLWNRESRPKAIYLIVPAIVYLVISSQSSLNIGFRHLLPIVPFLIVLMTGLVQSEKAWGSIPWFKHAYAAGVLAGSLFVVILIDLLIHPHYLSYFNLFAGGPSNGNQVLVDSNLDWGQDMLRLESWIEENQVDRIRLSWFGTADPDYYDIAYDPLPGLPYHFDLWWDLPFNADAPEPGVYAISASTLWELPLEDKTVFAWFRQREPDDRIGYSIHIYYVNDDA